MLGLNSLINMEDLQHGQSSSGCQKCPNRLHSTHLAVNIFNGYSVLCGSPALLPVTLPLAPSVPYLYLAVEASPDIFHCPTTRSHSHRYCRMLHVPSLLARSKAKSGLAQSNHLSINCVWPRSPQARKCFPRNKVTFSDLACLGGRHCYRCQ